MVGSFFSLRAPFTCEKRKLFTDFCLLLALTEAEKIRHLADFFWSTPRWLRPWNELFLLSLCRCTQERETQRDKHLPPHLGRRSIQHPHLAIIIIIIIINIPHERNRRDFQQCENELAWDPPKSSSHCIIANLQQVFVTYNMYLSSISVVWLDRTMACVEILTFIMSSKEDETKWWRCYNDALFLSFWGVDESKSKGKGLMERKKRRERDTSMRRECLKWRKAEGETRIERTDGL